MVGRLRCLPVAGFGRGDWRHGLLVPGITAIIVESSISQGRMILILKNATRIDAPLIIGLGFLEARLDHSLAAIHALMGLRHDRPVLLAGDTDVLLRLTGDIEITMQIGSRISIWPLGRQSFEASAGLRWPLAGLEMAPGEMIGTSNEVSATPVKIATTNDGDGYAVIAPVEAMAVLISAVMMMALPRQRALPAKDIQSR